MTFFDWVNWRIRRSKYAQQQGVRSIWGLTNWLDIQTGDILLYLADQGKGPFHEDKHLKILSSYVGTTPELFHTLKHLWELDDLEFRDANFIVREMKTLEGYHADVSISPTRVISTKLNVRSIIATYRANRNSAMTFCKECQIDTQGQYCSECGRENE